jgi:PD-(D/E)XK nuclease superfamily
VINLTLELPQAHPPEPKGELRPLLRPLPQAGHYLLVIDNSAMEMFTRCPTAALYYLVHRREAHARNAALTFGGALHMGLEALLRGKAEEEQDQAILHYFLENPAPPDEYRTPALALQVMRHYRERQALPDYHWTILSDGEPLIERPFELPLGVLEINSDIQLPSWPEPQRVKAIHVAWAGKMDLVANVAHRNRVTDHKTTSVAGEQYIPSFILAHQTIGYVWAAQQLWPSLEITGFCLNAIYIRRPGLGATNLMARGPRNGPGPLDFFRAHFDYSPERLEQWEENSLNLVADFVHCLVRGYFPMYTYHCFNKFGRCQYHDICTLDDPVVRQRMLMSDMYRDVTWSPTGQ